MIRKVEPIPGTQDIYLDAPKGQPQPEGSNPRGLDDELDAVAAGPQVKDESIIALPSDAEMRAHDRKPDTRDVEAALMLFEVNLAKNRELRWAGQERWAKQYEAERIGRVIHSRAFIRMMAGVGVELRANEYGRLGRIGINALACPACKMGPLAECAADCPGRGYVYKKHEIKGKLTRKAAAAARAAIAKPVTGRKAKASHKSRKGGPVLFTASKGERTFEWVTLATLHNGATPEYSVMRFDRYGVPTNEKYHGWRTALLDLMFAGVVTRSQAVRAFGKVERVSEATEFYLQQLQMVKW